jgi:RNA polymerase sigma factor (sigma-70 family)
MDARRVERTLLHKQFEIFRYSSALEKQGVVSPSEQIVAIGRFIEEGLGKATQLPRLSDREALDHWMALGITEVTTRWRKAHSVLEPLELLALRAGFFVAWNPYRDLSELLNARCGSQAYPLAAARLRARGFEVRLPDLLALTEPFLRFYLPRAVRSFDPRRSAGREVTWLATVFYRFALGQCISDQKNRHHLEVLRATGTTVTTLENVLEERAKEEMLAVLPVALEQLPAQEQLALTLYFGFSGREYTLSEVAGELGVSEYLARTAIARSIARLAASLGVQGPLDEQESALLRLLFVTGMDLKSAAKELQIDLKQAHHLTARILHKFRQGLRSRTTLPSQRLTRPRKDHPMDNTLVLSDEDIIAELKHLSQPPSLRTTSTGELLANIASNWVPVARIRKLIERSALLQMLQELHIPLDWLAIPDTTLERADVPDDAPEWAQALQELGQRSWVTAEALYHQCCDEAEHEHCLFVDEEADQTIERVHRTLAGVAQAIEMELPLALRRQGTARFRILWQEDEQVLGGWEGVSHGRRMDVRALAEESAELLGELPPQAVQVFVRVFIREIFAGDTTPPGFRRVAESTAKTVWLEWLAPQVTGRSLTRPSTD